MQLPALSVIIAIQAIIWCVAGVWSHGPSLLLYPFAWGAIASGFYFHSKLYPISTGGISPATSTQSTDDTGDKQQPADTHLAAG